MSNEFGQEFFAARNARNITLEEASEATKVKLEYLIGIENSSYDFDLPDIYLRGFTKIYAKSLKMDVDALLASSPIKEFEVLHSRLKKKVSYNTIIANEKEQDERSETEINDAVPFSKKVKWLLENFRTVTKNEYFIKIASILAII
jgi:cytoskeletal protein RodZ